MPRLIALTVGAALALVGCGADPDPPPQDPFVLALTGGDHDAIEAQLAADATLWMDDTRVDEGSSVVAAVAALSLTAEADASVLHDVWRAPIRDGEGQRRHVFARHGDDGVEALVVIAEGAQTTPAPLVAEQDTWNVTDATTRGPLLEQGFAEDGRYVDPGVDAPSRAALDEAIVDFQGQLPGAAIGANDALVGRAGPWVLFAWQITMGPTGLMEGFDVVKLDSDDQPVFVAGFFEPLAPTGAE